jgi:GTP-binding protein
MDTVLVLADIPGLIEGAHQGVGLGHDFLRHIQRTRVLIHLLDGMAEDPVLDYAQINSELALFDPNLANKPQVVAVNKIDLPDVQARLPEIEARLKEHGVKEPLAVSAVAGTNVRAVLYQAAKLLKETVEQAPAVEEAVPVYRAETNPREFTIQRTSQGWRVSGEAIERAANMTYWEYDQSARRFQRILATLGVEEALRKAGIQPGDTVFIGEHELEWSE